MVFRRRDRPSWPQRLKEILLPRGGWWRAAQYVGHRLRRLPDPPHRIARGIFAGVFISFTPFFGFHFMGAVLIAWALRGNIIAALLATFFGNPLTFPAIAIGSLEVGYWMIGGDSRLGLPEVLEAFRQAWFEIWANTKAVFTAAPTQWDRLGEFYHAIFLPYLIGGLVPGIVAGMICYYLSLPVIGAYQKLRARRLADKREKRLAARRTAGEVAASDPDPPA